ncbi:MAG: Asp-tRNA(Asn)/Glu-tRNA(Gln) amidotransferase subunit GatB [Christensenellales bacterium]
MSNTEYDIVIGLEVHAELNTDSKVFCSCKNEFGSEPNTNCCPVCIGMPGALPILNKKAVQYSIMAGLACNCEINDVAIFERKNYFYPDLSKTYQISQLVKPISINGNIKLDSGKIIRINRIHLEEDAGKLIHDLNDTYIDYNRGGVPLIETVSEPDISSADEAIEYLTKLRDRFIFAGVAKCKMEQGGMRCDVNLSVKPKNSNILGIRTEMKNLNSFKSVFRAIEFESKRQIDLIENGEKVIQETRKWDDNKGISLSMRSKEDSQDYRYFPDPDILTVEISRDSVEEIRKHMPASKQQRKDKYINEYTLPEKDTNILLSDKLIADYFEECLNYVNNPREVANWILTDVLKLNFTDIIPISAKHLADIIKMLLEKKITRQNAKQLFETIIEEHCEPLELAKKLDMLSTITENELDSLIENIIKENVQALNDYNKTPDKIIQFFTGQVMKQTKGKADAQKARELIVKHINNNLS